MIRMPDDGRALPIVARGEGRTLQTGVILRPPGATVKKLATNGEMAAPTVGLALEKMLRATDPLTDKPVDRSVPIELTGNMAAYVWGIAIQGVQALPVTVTKPGGHSSAPVRPFFFRTKVYSSSGESSSDGAAADSQACGAIQ